MIEELAPSDESAAVALWNATGLTRPWNDAGADFRRALANDSSTVLGVREGGQLTGAVMVGDDGHRGWVYYLAVAPSAHGRGFGRALMETAEQWLAARGCVKIQFMVRTDNAAVHGFYERLGYPVADVVTRGRRLD
jgi:ribosomal protein S18 acetylase RimI-like enzyme